MNSTRRQPVATAEAYAAASTIASTTLRLSHRFTNGSTCRTGLIFAFSIVAQNCSRGETVRNAALIIFAALHVSPQPLHVGAMRCNRALSIFIGALGGVMQQQQSLLLVTDSDLPFGVVPTRATRTATAITAAGHAPNRRRATGASLTATIHRVGVPTRRHVALHVSDNTVIAHGIAGASHVWRSATTSPFSHSVIWWKVTAVSIVPLLGAPSLLGNLHGNLLQTLLQCGHVHVGLKGACVSVQRHLQLFCHLR